VATSFKIVPDNLARATLGFRGSCFPRHFATAHLGYRCRELLRGGDSSKGRSKDWQLLKFEETQRRTKVQILREDEEILAYIAAFMETL
jgi:hypothetical protein